jgi:hypothetical protein
LQEQVNVDLDGMVRATAILDRLKGGGR